MFNKILVPLDGSELSERALELAIPLAAHANGELFLMRVPKLTQVVMTGELGASPPEGGDTSPQSIVEQYLYDVATANAHPQVTMYTIVGEGDVPEAIVDVANQQGIDLIIMATRGRSGPALWVLGSTTKKVSKISNIPTLVVRTNRPTKEILVPLDGSELAENAIPVAAEIVRAVNGVLILMHSSTKNSRQRTALKQGPKLYLRSVADRYKHLVPRLQTHSEMGKPVSNILKAADMLLVDLIVLTAHGHSGANKTQYGKVTRKILKNSACSTLVVPV